MLCCHLPLFHRLGAGLPTGPDLFVGAMGIHQYDLALAILVPEGVSKIDCHVARILLIRAGPEALAFDINPPSSANEQNDVGLNSPVALFVSRRNSFHICKRTESATYRNRKTTIQRDQNPSVDYLSLTNSLRMRSSLESELGYDLRAANLRLLSKERLATAGGPRQKWRQDSPGTDHRSGYSKRQQHRAAVAIFEGRFPALQLPCPSDILDSRGVQLSIEYGDEEEKRHGREALICC